MDVIAVTEQMPQDYMHDVLEGVAQYELKLILQMCIGKI